MRNGRVLGGSVMRWQRRQRCWHVRYSCAWQVREPLRGIHPRPALHHHPDHRRRAGRLPGRARPVPARGQPGLPVGLMRSSPSAASTSVRTAAAAANAAAEEAAFTTCWHCGNGPVDADQRLNQHVLLLASPPLRVVAVLGRSGCAAIRKSPLGSAAACGVVSLEQFVEHPQAPSSGPPASLRAALQARRDRLR